ncbi:MAG: hypothetical protein WC960_00880 [Bacteroidales bacterium]
MKKFLLPLLLLPLFLISCEKEQTQAELPQSLSDTYWKTIPSEATRTFEYAEIYFYDEEEFSLRAKDVGGDLEILSEGVYNYSTTHGIITLHSTNSVLSGRVINLSTMKLQIYDEEVEGDSEIPPFTFQKSTPPVLHLK